MPSTVPARGQIERAFKEAFTRIPLLRISPNATRFGRLLRSVLVNPIWSQIVPGLESLRVSEDIFLARVATKFVLEERADGQLREAERTFDSLAVVLGGLMPEATSIEMHFWSPCTKEVPFGTELEFMAECVIQRL